MSAPALSTEISCFCMSQWPFAYSPDEGIHMGRRDSVKRQMTPFPFTFPANTSIVPLETQSILALPEILLPANEEGSGAVTTDQPSERASERALAGAAAAGCGVMSSALVPSVSSSWLAGREGRREGTGRPAGRPRPGAGKQRLWWAAACIVRAMGHIQSGGVSASRCNARSLAPFPVSSLTTFASALSWP